MGYAVCGRIIPVQIDFALNSDYRKDVMRLLSMVLFKQMTEDYAIGVFTYVDEHASKLRFCLTQINIGLDQHQMEMSGLLAQLFKSVCRGLFAVGRG